MGNEKHVAAGCETIIPRPAFGAATGEVKSFLHKSYRMPQMVR